MIKERIDRYLIKIIRWLLPLIFLLPFVVSRDYYFPYITLRNFLFRIIVSVIFACYLYLFFRHKKKYSPGNNRIIIAYFSLALVLTISSIVNGDFWYSFWSNYERMDGLITLYYVIALFLLILGVYRHQKDWLLLLRFSVWSSFMMSVIALSQHWGINIFLESSGGERVTGTLGNATYLAVYSLFNFFFALYLLLKYKNYRPKLELWSFYALDIFLICAEAIGVNVIGANRGLLAGIFSDIRLIILFLVPQLFINLQYYFYNSKRTIKYSWQAYFVLVILLNFIALFNTQTRGVLVGLFSSGLAVSIFLLFSRYVNKKTKHFIIACLVLFILFISSIFIFKNSGFVQNNGTLRRIANISISDSTAETRILTWRLSLKGFEDKPILGWGEENFYIVFNKYFPNQIFKSIGSTVWFDRPHNVFLQHLVQGGILGLIVYLSIFVFALHNLWKHYKKTRDPLTISILGALMIAYLVQNFFVFDSLNSYILVVIFLAVSIFLSADYKSGKEWPWEKYLAVPALLLVLIIGFYLNIPKLKANYEFIAQYTSIQGKIAWGKYQRSDLDKLLAQIDRQYLGKFELRQVYTEFSSGLIKMQVLSPEETAYFVEQAEDLMLGNIEEQPNNVRHHAFLINLYLNASLLDPYYAQKGVDLIENKALALSPTRVQLYYFLGQFYFSLNQNDKALDSFVKARELAPQVFDSYYNLIMASLAIKNLDLVDSYFAQMKQNVQYITKENYSSLSGLYDYFGYKDRLEQLE